MSEVIYKYKNNMLAEKKLRVQWHCDHDSYPKHWHSYYEITYYRNCYGRCILNGKSYPIEGSCIFLLTPKDFHEIILEDSTGSEYFVLSFNEQIIDDVVFFKVTKGPFYIRQFPERSGKQVEYLYEIFCGQSEYRSGYLYHLFNCVLIDILELGSRLSHAEVDISPMIQESISMMLSDPAAQFTLETFSQKFNVGTTYFSRLFRKSTGIGFKQYLTILRIGYAKRLLEEKKLPIIDVGCECGFNTPSQFVRAFKQLTGMTPSAYRTAVERDC